MSKLTFFAIALILLMAPAMAAPYPSTVDFSEADSVQLTGVTNTHYNATPGNAIGNIVFTTPQNTNVTFTIGYGRGETISGGIDYYAVEGSLIGLEYSFYSTSHVYIGDNETSSTYLDAGGGAINRYAVAGHAVDTDAGTSGLGVWDTSLLTGYHADNIAYVAIPGIANKPIYWIDIQANHPIEVDISVGEQKYIQSQATKNPVDIFNEWLDLGKNVLSFIYGTIVTVFAWMVFIWENIGLIIALYIGITGFMAFRAGKRNILRSIQIFFRYQRTLFEVLLALPYYLIDLIDKAKSLLTRWL